MLAKRKVRSNELADAIGITQSNLSLLKSGHVRGVRFSTLEAICMKAIQKRREDRYQTAREMRIDVRGVLEDPLAAARKRAIMLLSALVGALGLARAVDDERLSVEILEATADGLINSIDAPPEP